MAPALKRRKVRRGTSNCWECKRRKIRCTYAVPTEAVCDSCKSRGVQCISQQFQEDCVHGSTEACPETVEAVTGTQVTCVGEGSTRTKSRPRSRPRRAPGTQADSLGPSAAEPRPRCDGTPPTDNGLCLSLLDAWPAQAERDWILSVPVSTSILLHGLVCAPYSDILFKDTPSARDILQLPSANAHPVLIARRLLLQAILLQGIPAGSLSTLAILNPGHDDTMSRLVCAARRVTSDDELVGSLEGIECIMMEAMYYNNAGNLRRAWTAHRRALTAAQMLGLHRLPSTTIRLPVLDAETKRRVHPEHMWHRLITTDRYLSLMLGLPQCVSESPLTSPTTALDSCTPLERLERLESVVGGLILQRNRDDLHDVAKTREMDNLLQQAAALMPAKWWLTPDMSAITRNGEEALGETLRLMNQLTHYHLLAQLHLPYLLQTPGHDRKYDYHKITAVWASREMLSRFVAFRGSNSVTPYCRGVDFLAFIASTVLCLAHIDARRQQRSSLGFLAHQRLGDRGLLEETLQCVEGMSRVRPCGDALASKIAHVLRHLLVIEARAAGGAYYTTSSAEQPGVPGEPGVVESEDQDHQRAESGEALHLCIPYFGTVKIELGNDAEGQHPLLQLDQSPSSRPFSAQDEPSHGIGHATTDRGTYETSSRHADEVQATPPLTVPESPGRVDDWVLQGVDMALFDNLIRAAPEPAAESTTGTATAAVPTEPPARLLNGEIMFESWIGNTW